MPLQHLPTRLLIFAAALCCTGALLLWWPQGGDAPTPIVDSHQASAPDRPGDSIVPSAEPPDAMGDATTYAAVRLVQIKAAPEPWRDPWKWRSEFSAAPTPAVQREVVAL